MRSFEALLDPQVMPEAYLESAFPKALELIAMLKRLEKAHLPLLRHVQKQLSRLSSLFKGGLLARKGRPKAVRERVEEEETPEARGVATLKASKWPGRSAEGGEGDLG